MIAPFPPMGWNSWDCYGAAVTEEIVRQNADYMAGHLKQFGWEYIVVDIQWYQPTAINHAYEPFSSLTMDEYGRLLPAENRFPSAANGAGFQPLADYVKKDHPEKYDESGMLIKPEKGMVTFTFDAGSTLEKVLTLAPGQETVTPLVTARCIEAAFTPLMTYLTLDLEGNAQALSDYKTANGEGYYDEEGNLLWPFTSLDVHHDYIVSLTLVDGSGKPVFPGHQGFNGVGDKWAEFLYPSMEKLPDELWLAPMTGDVVDMTEAIRIK